MLLHRISSGPPFNTLTASAFDGLSASSSHIDIFNAHSGKWLHTIYASSFTPSRFFGHSLSSERAVPRRTVL